MRVSAVSLSRIRRCSTALTDLTSSLWSGSTHVEGASSSEAGSGYRSAVLPPLLLPLLLHAGVRRPLAAATLSATTLPAGIEGVFRGMLLSKDPPAPSSFDAPVATSTQLVSGRLLGLASAMGRPKEPGAGAVGGASPCTVPFGFVTNAR